MKRMKIKTEHAGPKNGGGWWGSRAEAKDLSRLLRRRNDKQTIEHEVIAMCGRDDDPTTYDIDGVAYEPGAECPMCDGPTTKSEVLCWYCDDEPAAILAADRDDPHIDYASEV